MAERLQWEVQQLECSYVLVVDDSELEPDALCYGIDTTWIAGGGSRANLKFEGLPWPEMRDAGVRHDKR